MKGVINMLQGFEFRNAFWCLILPLCLMGFDVLTGFLNAWIKKEVKSAKLRAGLSKKVGELAILVIGELFSFALKLPPELMKFLAFYIIFMELVSVMENLDKLGVPIPKSIKKVINNTNDVILNSDDVVRAEEIAEVVKEVTNDKTGNDRKGD